MSDEGRSRSRGWGYPLSRTQDRTFEPGFSGDVFYWDIDKTYLATEFETLGGLLTTSMEMAVDKRNVAGTGILLRALRRGIDQAAFVSNPIYFVSASPKQMRRVLEEKMLLDGVEFDGITLKVHVGLLRSGRVRQFRDSIPYKLTALLLYRRELPWNVREILFGDDSEADPLIYALYADIVAGRLRGDDLRYTLKKPEVERKDRERLVKLTDTMPTGDLVHRIYIHLAKGTEPRDFEPWGDRLVPCRNAFQAALHLASDGLVHTSTATEVAQLLHREHQVSASSLRNLGAAMVRRGILDGDWWEAHRAQWEGEGLSSAEAVLSPDLVPTRRVILPDFITPAHLLDAEDPPPEDD